MKQVEDPLKVLLSEYTPQNGLVKRISSGSKYILVELEDGRAGLAGSPGSAYKPLRSCPEYWDLDDVSHRQFLTAYYNALLNDLNAAPGNPDLEAFLNSSGWKKCLMIGYFKPLYKRLMSQGIGVIPFDIEKEDPEVRDQADLLPMLAEVGQVIATPLIFINGSWREIWDHITEDHSVILTGPSATYHPAYRELRGVSGVFGSTVSICDDALRGIVAEGGGMQAFKHLLIKSSF